MDTTDEERSPTLPDGGPLVRIDGVLDSSVDDERVVLDTDSEIYYGLNEVGAHLWEQLEKPRSVDELVTSTAEEFDVATSECREDVRSFLADLLDVGLVERV